MYVTVLNSFLRIAELLDRQCRCYHYRLQGSCDGNETENRMSYTVTSKVDVLQSPHPHEFDASAEQDGLKYLCHKNEVADWSIYSNYNKIIHNFTYKRAADLTTKANK
jgi:hypothetical protein